MAQVEEPLLESAPLAWRIAPQRCRMDAATGAGCSPVHGIWQYLRLLELVTTPSHHADFLRDAFAEAAPAGGRIGVLVSGAVDYSMLAHVLWACDLRRIAADVTVVDVCDTPLFLNQWYADRLRRPIRSLRENLLDLRADAAYDVVCTHSFLSQFAPPDRQRLVVNWARLLKPGGRVITVNRIRAGDGTGSFTYSGQQVQALREAVLQRAEQWGARLGVEPDLLARGAANYAGHRRIHPVASSDEIAALFTQAGFTLDHLSSAPATPGPLHASATSQEAWYAHVIARRP